jgi:hypothetical protein
MLATNPLPILQAKSPAALRAELERLVVNDLLGPAGGPFEQVDETQIQERYLVGKLAPRSVAVPQEQSDELAVADDGSGEDGATEPNTLQGDGLYPSAMGLSFTLDGSVAELRVTAHWGWYKREKSEDILTEKGNPKTVWCRTPMSGTVDLSTRAGDLPNTPLNHAQPEVVIRGRMRRSGQGLWHVSLFLVHTQTYRKGEGAKGEPWLFQPELEVEAPDQRPVFVRQRTPRPTTHQDPARLAEEQAMQMLYRDAVEFAVGHGVAVDWTTVPDDPRRAVRLATRVVPTYEVRQVSSASEQDNPDLAGLVLDMKALAEMDTGALVGALERLPTAYRCWIARERTRSQDPARGLADHQEAARAALADCDQACQRIAAGVALLKSDAQALDAFQFANRAMAAHPYPPGGGGAPRRGAGHEHHRPARQLQLAAVPACLHPAQPARLHRSASPGARHRPLRHGGPALVPNRRR